MGVIVSANKVFLSIVLFGLALTSGGIILLYLPPIELPEISFPALKAPAVELPELPELSSGEQTATIAGTTEGEQVENPLVTLVLIIGLVMIGFGVLRWLDSLI